MRWRSGGRSSRCATPPRWGSASPRCAAPSTCSSTRGTAAIAARHSAAASFAETDWTSIRELYHLLASLRPTPVVALNRAIAVGMAEGPEAGLRALAGIEDRDRLARYPFLPAAVAEFELRAGRPERAARQLRAALLLARNPAEEAVLARKLAACGASS